MKYRTVSVMLFFFTLLFSSGGCKKSPASIATGGGKGGNFVIMVTPEHHGFYVDTCTIYIKYNTLDAPSNGIYDDSMVCAMVDTIPVAVFPGLKKGDYYIYGHGYHTLYVPPYVQGGVPCTISSQDTTKVYLPTYSY